MVVELLPQTQPKTLANFTVDADSLCKEEDTMDLFKLKDNSPRVPGVFLKCDRLPLHMLTSIGCPVRLRATVAKGLPKEEFILFQACSICSNIAKYSLSVITVIIVYVCVVDRFR